MNRFVSIAIRIIYLSWLAFFFYQSVCIWPEYSFHPFPSMALLTMMIAFVVAVEWDNLDSWFKTIKKWITRRDS